MLRNLSGSSVGGTMFKNKLPGEKEFAHLVLSFLCNAMHKCIIGCTVFRYDLESFRETVRPPKRLRQ